MIVPLPDVHVGIGVATVLVSLPLVLRMVPMNRGYGIRVRQAFTSKENWYAVNAYGGWLFMAFGVFLIAFGTLTRDLAPPPTSLLAPVFFVAPLLAIVPVIALIKSYARRLPNR